MAISGLIGAGASDALDDIIVQQLAKKKFEEQIRAQQAQEAQQQQRLSQDASQHADLMGVRTRGLDIEDAARRDRSNRQGVEDMERQAQMMAAGEHQRAVEDLIGQLPQGPRQVVAGLKARGVNVDDVPDPTEAAEAEARALRLHEGKAKIDARFREPRGGLHEAHGGAPEQEWVIRDGQEVPIPKGTARLGDKPYSKDAASGGEPSAYTAERSARTLAAARDLKDEVSDWTAGAGSLLGNVPGTQARNFKAKLDTLKANIAFNELNQMRAASKTGGALGAVSERELALLESTLGALDAGQSPAQLAGQLDQVAQSIERWQNAQALSGRPRVNAQMPGGGPPVGTERIIGGKLAVWDGRGWRAQ